MTQDIEQMTDLVTEFEIKVQSMKLDKRPDRDLTDMVPEDKRWDREASHWFCRVYSTHLTGEVTCFYSMGSAIKGKPQADDVLSSLLLDATSSDESFEDWCSSFGYDVDSRRALGMWEAGHKVMGPLRDLLGSEFSRFSQAEH